MNEEVHEQTCSTGVIESEHPVVKQPLSPVQTLVPIYSWVNWRNEKYHVDPRARQHAHRLTLSTTVCWLAHRSSPQGYSVNDYLAHILFEPLRSGNVLC